MRHSNIFVAFIVLIATGLLIFYGVAVLSPVETLQKISETKKITTLDQPKIDFGNPRRGAEKPELTIVEYGDYVCEACAQMDADVQTILKDFPTKVAVVWKDFPNTSLHASAEQAAEAARCAGQQGAFWEYHDVLFANQDSITADNFPVLAAPMGLDGASMLSCLDAKTMQPIVQRDFDEALQLHITATPTLFIGQRRVEGAIGYDRLRSLVETALSQPAQGTVK